MPDSNVIALHQEDERLQDERQQAARIAAAILAGDSAAETELVTRYERGLEYLLSRYSRDAELARDLLQETFLIALEKLRESALDDPARLAGFLKGIALNVARSGVRKRAKEPGQLAEGQLERLPDDAARPFAALSADETGAAVLALLESMTVERDRELLRRFYIYDQDKPEICRALDLDSLHFNRVLHRAKARFRKILEDSANSGGLE